MAMRQQRDTSSFLLSHHSIRLPSRQPLPLPVLAFQADPTRPRNHSHLIHRKPDPNAPKLLRIIECPRPPAQPAKKIQRNSPQRERQSENKGQGKKLKSQTREKSSLSQVLFKQEMENALRKMSKKQQGETSCDLDRTRLNKSSFKTVKELAHRRKRSTKTQIASPMPIEKWSDFCSSAPYLIVPPAILLKPKPRRIRVESRAASRSMQQMLLGDRGEELRGWAEKEARESGLRYWADDEQTSFLGY